MSASSSSSVTLAARCSSVPREHLIFQTTTQIPLLQAVMLLRLRVHGHVAMAIRIPGMLLSFLLPVVQRHLRISDLNRKRPAWHQLLVPAMLLIPLLLSVRPRHPVHQLPAIILLSILCVLLLEVPAWMVLRHLIDPQGTGITSHQRRRHLGDGLRFLVTVYSDREVRR